MSSPPAAVDRKRTAGFALIEVLVAVAVAAVILTALLRAFVTTWTGINAVREETEAMLIARALVSTAAPRDNTVEANQRGDMGRYSWSIAVQKAPTVAPPVDADADAATAITWTLFRIVVVVRAPSGRSTSLETLRLSRTAP
jgi:prepilin-type N-terminal cleavage/methylation domain-containing protein